ncbi:hypothetical protein LOTGIDRAFT_174137 [Lottia gigantea]|uniref:Uncharacterized protein n=1 Tax=Lottia gigantea TaxID=225164 RepID=V4A3W9_LOTGI|nr:hypothetical protein LOTGIDRAFT_174137 [Lottia gigantea]ESO98603.1 hypothetical protein LOTGIDRAFT_174137 [Lottia gigantea]
MSRSRWLVTFVIDLKPSQNFISSLKLDATHAFTSLYTVINNYSSKTNDIFFDKLLSNNLQQTRIVHNQYNELMLRASQFTLLKKKRPRRALLPIVGKALSFLFGTVSTSDLKVINTNIDKLAAKQTDIIHVLDKSLSILNTSRIEIAKNRVSINALVYNLKAFEPQVTQLLTDVTKEVNKVKGFLQLTSKINFIIKELQNIIFQGLKYFDHLNLQLNMLSLGHISPSTISPSDLKSLLGTINGHLPTSVHLPVDPDDHLWKYYKFLTCSAVLSSDTLLIIFNLPLLDSNRKLEIFQAHNLPVPFTSKRIINDTHDLQTMVAVHELESEYLAVNAERTQFALLQPSEVDRCSHAIIHFCSIHSPLYPINLSKLCITALFMKNQKLSKQVGKVNIQTKSVFPMATYLMDVKDKPWAHWHLLSTGIGSFIGVAFILMLIVYCIKSKLQNSAKRYMNKEGDAIKYEVIRKRVSAKTVSGNTQDRENTTPTPLILEEEMAEETDSQPPMFKLKRPINQGPGKIQNR